MYSPQVFKRMCFLRRFCKAASDIWNENGKLKCDVRFLKRGKEPGHQLPEKAFPLDKEALEQS